MTAPNRKANALANETSPYLLQHAYNPVNWAPWGTAAFEEARRRDVPVLLSVGYSACHWCHVMERESFENQRIAKLMNEWFVPVKVDREERPDVDGVYMNAVQAMTGQGGWPMTVFVTPDGEPFYGGTYFPPDDRFGRIGFARLLEAIHDAWVNRRDEVRDSAAELTRHLRGMDRVPAGDDPLDAALAARCVDALAASFDADEGGFGSAPKFPNPGALEFLLQYHARTGDPRALLMTLGTLEGMARGGMHDQLGGGFARYSTDERWLVPHFEKMLYDNAQLARVYVHAWQVTRDERWAAVARDTLDYVLREMTAPDGGFYASQDADSEGEEGRYFLWSLAEVREVLGADADLFASAYGVTEAGNWEGRNVLFLARDAATVAAESGVTEAEVRARLESARARLLERREARPRPARDDKVLAGWNGLMTAAFATAGRALAEPRYVDAARRNAAFVREHLMPGGRLKHSFKDGRAGVDAFLDDHALVALGFLELYRATFDDAALEAAVDLARVILARFRDDAGGFYDTADDAERLVTRPKNVFDAAAPSGNGAAALLLQELARLTGRFEWEDVALEPVRSVARFAARQPTGFGSALQVLEGHLRPPREIAIVGDLDGSDGRAMLAEVHARYLPHVALAAASEARPVPPVLEGREPPAGASVAAFVCENLACRLPVTTAGDLAAALDAP